jgi:1-aminocyclopropane-1-carboxylate deaminase/D-cysteine desulfhydrase-like pyridoxal-dependent ACC family enzyme
MFFDTIVVCSVTGSTQAAMVVGFAAWPPPVAGRAKSSASTRQPSRLKPVTRSPASRWRSGGSVR